MYCGHKVSTPSAIAIEIRNGGQYIAVIIFGTPPSPPPISYRNLKGGGILSSEVVLQKLRLHPCERPTYNILIQTETMGKVHLKFMYLLLLSINIIISNLILNL